MPSSANAADFLAIDVGNTKIAFGVMSGMQVIERLSLPSREEIAPDHREHVEAALRNHPALRQAPAVIASVNPRGAARARAVIDGAFGGGAGERAIMLGEDHPVSVENRTGKPEQVGIDRLVNAMAAWRIARREVIVVDFGTAITFDVVSSDGAYLGGVITPGIGLAMKALSENTALLPLVRPEGRPPVLGRDTISAINAGAYHGFVGLARNILEELFKLFERRPRVIATGGDGSYLASALPLIDEVLPDLTLQGIRLAWQPDIGWQP